MYMVAGVILFDQSQGFWLTHSVPHFPPFPERGYDYPSSGKYYGQTLNCITYNYTQFPFICEHILITFLFRSTKILKTCFKMTMSLSFYSTAVSVYLSTRVQLLRPSGVSSTYRSHGTNL